MTNLSTRQEAATSALLSFGWTLPQVGRLLEQALGQRDEQVETLEREAATTREMLLAKAGGRTDSKGEPFVPGALYALGEEGEHEVLAFYTGLGHFLDADSDEEIADPWGFSSYVRQTGAFSREHARAA